MARKPAQRLIKGNVDEGLSLSTLADVTALKDNFDETVTERAFALSLEASWTIRGLTVGEGPIWFGVAHSDYTVTEIEEYVENAGSWDVGNLVAQEQGRRKIRIIGVFDGELADQAINDGVPLKTILKFMLESGDTLALWCYNKSGGALTTGAAIQGNGHVWLRPA